GQGAPFDLASGAPVGAGTSERGWRGDGGSDSGARGGTRPRFRREWTGRAVTAPDRTGGLPPAAGAPPGASGGPPGTRACDSQPVEQGRRVATLQLHFIACVGGARRCKACNTSNEKSPPPPQRGALPPRLRPLAETQHAAADADGIAGV